MTNKLIKQSLVLFFLGGLQAIIGWWMVKSGLIDRPDVSHYRLAIHLITAFLTCAYIVWVVLSLILSNNIGNSKLFRLNLSLFILIVIQIIYGAFIAGLDAGRVCNTWPKMCGEWIPSSISSINPLWKNFVEGHYGTQFIHRSLALIIVSFVLYIWFYSKKYKLSFLQQKSLNILLWIVTIQTLLGICTLVLFVPISLALLHQIVGFFLLISVVFTLFLFKKS